MTWLGVVALAGAMFVLAATPGPGVFATLARAVASGFSHAAVLVVGVVIGDLLFLLLAIYGLAAVAELLGGLFSLVRYAGGLYLVWLGYQMWRSSTRLPVVSGVKELSWSANLLSGLVITLGNPKVVLFYLGFLPTFMDLSALTHGDVAVAAAVVSVVLAAVLLTYAYAASRARHLFRKPSSVRILNRGAGGVMMTTGVVLIARS